MTDLHHVLPDFSTKTFTHLLPSLEKAQVTVSDLLTLEAIDIARRALVPVAELQRLANDLLQALHSAVRSEHQDADADADAAEGIVGPDQTRYAANIGQGSSWETVQTLDKGLDTALGGGIPKGYVVEVTGESGAGKTQFLLLLLLSAQLPVPLGFAKSTLYISTEAPLQTARLSQMLDNHPHLSNEPANRKPSLSKVLSIQTPDLESQEHILQYQLPVVIRRQNIGLVVVDSIAANYRAEFDRPGVKHSGAAMAQRGTQLTRLGHLLRQIARDYSVAIVVANQVADRFSAVGADVSLTYRQASHSYYEGNAVFNQPRENNTTPRSTQSSASQADFEPLTLDHQQRWFTGWGDEHIHGPESKAYKTPSLGLVWTNQIAARIALIKEPLYAHVQGEPGHLEREIIGWKRQMKVVFAPWAPPSIIASGQTAAGIPFEIVDAGVKSLNSLSEAT
ncbi:MAG: hypothetical protein Q9157_009104 [Trypethelium eluteriae]